MAKGDKMLPAATEKDQEGVVRRTLGKPIVLGTPAYSSPDPATSAKQMLPVTNDSGDGSENPSEMKAADFKGLVDAATTQEELYSAVNLYEESGKDYSSVVDAIEKKQNELNAS